MGIHSHANLMINGLGPLAFILKLTFDDRHVYMRLVVLLLLGDLDYHYVVHSPVHYESKSMMYQEENKFCFIISRNYVICTPNKNQLLAGLLYLSAVSPLPKSQ